jgi:membrane protein DedA with SNARE-associated domain
MTDFLLSHGPYLAYLGIVFFMTSTGAGFPLPEEVFIIAAGVASAHGALDPWVALAACLVGALAGDCVMYWIGYHFGRRVVREHHWWTRFVKPHRESQMEEMIHKHGLKVFFLARFLVGIRSPVYLTAGILHIGFRRFLLIDLFCATTVIGTFFGLSYFLTLQFGETIGEAVYSWIRGAEILVTVVVVLVLVGVGIYWWRRHRHKAASDESRPTENPSIESAQPEKPIDEIERERVA